ncbi:MAG: hypothetical protein CW691_07455 [Candidatus Bathyarchaeum sp.]|nr:MAG: hypothetical protein CW691_07455 [Candidatus Bathyarchaeum sp.]
MNEIPPVPERISERKIIVYKSRVDPTIVKLTAEKMKYKLFGKFGFSKSRSEEIRVVSVDKYYEPYVLIDANYHIQYSKKRVYTLRVDPETEEVKIAGESYKPEMDSPSVESGASSKVIKLQAQMWSSYQDKAYLALDKEGHEIPHNQVPAAPSEDHPEEILNEFSKKTGLVNVSSQKEIELVKARIVKRPSDISKIEDELFHVSEHAVIYSPVYEITFRNVRTGEEKLVKIDGVTAKIIS